MPPASNPPAPPERGAMMTFVASARIRPGAEAAFADWQVRHQEAIAQSPGFVSSAILPIGMAANRAWIVVATFRTGDDLVAWQKSAARAALIVEVLPLYESGNIGLVTPSDGSVPVNGDSVVEVVLSRVKPGMEALYHAWTIRIEQVQATFPGYRGMELQPPVSARQGHWTVLVNFDTKDHLRAWMDSPERAALLEEAKGFIETEEVTHAATAFPGWVPVNPVTGESPPNWKTAMLVLLGLFPTVMLEQRFLGPYLGFLNPALAMFIGNVGSVAVTTFLTMPLCIRWFGWWLFVDRDSPRWWGLGGFMAMVALYAVEIALFRHILS